MRRKPMQVSIEAILKAHGKLEAFTDAFANGGEFYLKLEQDGYEPLVIEKITPDDALKVGRVAIAHFFVQNGDVMYDPEIVFSYRADIDACHWVPIEITQSLTEVYRRKFFERDGKTYVDTRFDRAVGELVRVWAKNLRWQGWESAAIAGEN